MHAGFRHYERVHLAKAGSAACSHGLTLIELMVVVALVAILMAVAVPSFQGVVRSNRINGEINAFVGDLQLARSEAIKRGLPVSLCPSSNGTDCLTTNTWHNGWIVFFDPDSSGDRNLVATTPAEELIKVQPAWRATDTFVATPVTTRVTYTRDGFATALPAGAELTMALRTTPVDNNFTRCVQLNRVGRQVVQRSGVGVCT